MMDDRDYNFDDHPSLDASLEDFEHDTTRNSPIFDLPSQHSGFRDDDVDGSINSEGTSDEADKTKEQPPWSPPGLRGYDYVPRSSWYRHQPYPYTYGRGSGSDSYLDKLDLRPSVGNSKNSRRGQPQSRDGSSWQFEDAKKEGTGTGTSTSRKEGEIEQPVALVNQSQSESSGTADQLSNCRDFSLSLSLSLSFN